MKKYGLLVSSIFGVSVCGTMVPLAITSCSETNYSEVLKINSVGTIVFNDDSTAIMEIKLSTKGSDFKVGQKTTFTLTFINDWKNYTFREEASDNYDLSYTISTNLQADNLTAADYISCNSWDIDYNKITYDIELKKDFANQNSIPENYIIFGPSSQTLTYITNDNQTGTLSTTYMKGSIYKVNK